MEDTLETRRRRLLYRSLHTGTKETDLILEGFARVHLAGLSPVQLDRYERLLAAPEADLFAWVTGRSPVPADHDHDVMALLMRHNHARHRVDR